MGQRWSARVGNREGAVVGAQRLQFACKWCCSPAHAPAHYTTQHQRLLNSCEPVDHEAGGCAGGVGQLVLQDQHPAHGD